MKPSEHCKIAGLKGLNHLAELTGQSVQTLTNWHRDNFKLFEAALKNATKSREGK
jgi:hypothetical protein